MYLIKIIDHMNKIYGFGSALIDIEIRISDDQLKKYHMCHSHNYLTLFFTFKGYQKVQDAKFYWGSRIDSLPK